MRFILTGSMQAWLLNAAIVSVVTLTSACGGGGGSGPTPAPMLQPPVFEPLNSRAVSLQVMDSLTGEPVNGTLTVIDGEGLVEAASARQLAKADVDIPIVAGLASILVRNNISEPANLRYRISSAGFVTTSGTLEIDAGSDTVSVVRLTSLTSPPAGVASQTQTVDLSNGPAVIDLVNQAAPGGPITNRVRLTIPPDIQLLDRNEQPIAGTQVRVEQTLFGTTEADSLLSFPGGLDVVIENADDPAIAVEMNGGDGATFESAGFVSVDMFVGNTEVKKFDKPVTLRISVNPATIDPATDEPVRCGAVVPVWSLDNDSGQWRFEGDGQVQQEGNADCANEVSTGELFVEIDTTHLTYFNLDYLNSNARRCRATIDLRDSSGNPVSALLSARLTVPGRGFARLGSPSTRSVITAVNVPSDLRYDIQVINASTGQPVPITAFNGSIDNVNDGKLRNLRLCDARNPTQSASPLVASLDVAQLPPLLDARVAVEAVCTRDRAVRSPAPTLVFLCSRTGGGCHFGRIADGNTVAFKVSSGDYRVYAYDTLRRGFDITERTISATAPNLTVELPRECSVVNPTPTSAPTGGTGSSNSGGSGGG